MLNIYSIRSPKSLYILIHRMLQDQGNDALYRGIALETFRDLYLSCCPTILQAYGSNGVEFQQGEVRYFWQNMSEAYMRVVIEVIEVK
jgi:hypothetical protein